MRKVVAYKAKDSWHYFRFGNEEYKSGTIEEVCGHLRRGERVFLLQVSDFIREYDKAYPSKELPLIVDIESFVKQFSQKSKPLETQKKWNFFKFLKENEYLPKEFRIQDSIEAYLSQIANFITELLHTKATEELSRFESIELPINRLIYERQRKGINIDQTIYPVLIKSTEEELYNIKNRLQLEHEVYSPDDILTQINILEKEGLEIRGSILSLFKSKKSTSELCKLIYEMIRADNDLRALIYLTSNKGGKSRTYPNFHGFGSISSRITLREPALQNLRKKARSIIKPDDDFEFIYVDYSQFEAGILASLSQDDKLMKLYDSDIYEDINMNVWSGLKDRDEAKMLFYKYMYGMELRLASENRYFKSFTKLTKFKNDVEKGIESNAKVGSSHGNYRLLSIEDKKVALSHRIQSEASLIFKEALLKISESVSEAHFILPMHDAALYQVNTKIHNKRRTEKKIQKIFQDVFASRCPGINPSARISTFYVD